jgi:branched-chain amino acid transport system ATP-binding protein/branched-chain amino acid transport system permease protein
MTGRVGSAARDVRVAVGTAGRDLARAWTRASWLWFAAAAAAFAAPFVLGAGRTGDAAGWLCTVLAAIGLNAAVGLGGIPVLSQGAFMAVGAFAVGRLTGVHGWDPASAALVGIALSLAAGAAVGVVAARLRPAFVAVATWLVAWLVGLALDAFAGPFGGSQGLVVRSLPFHLFGVGPAVTMTPTILFETALVLVVCSLIAFRVVARSRPGLGLAAVRQGPDAAAALGVPGPRLEWGAVAAAAGVAGAAGAVAALVAGIADPASYGPLRSVELFVAVLLGGAGTTLGPVAGAAVLAALPRLSAALGSVIGVEQVRFEPVVTALLLLAALLLLGRGGLVRAAGTLWRHLAPGAPTPAVPDTADMEHPPAEAPPEPPERPGTRPVAVLEAHGLERRFGGVVATDGVDLRLEPGRVHALIGPNGSGKTTLLRLLAGDLDPDAGGVSIDGADVTGTTELDRVRLGIARTLQATSVFPDLTALEHAEAGTVAGRDDGGAIRTILATPRARAGARSARARAMTALDTVGLARRAATPAERLTATEQRMLMIAAALASDPRVLLLDEPAAGMVASDLPRLAAVLERLAARGMALLLVEHNLRLVRRVASTVTVLDAGRVIAEGAPAEVAERPEVRLAYLGLSRD